MAADAYDLQGMNGWELVTAGQTFTGKSRGVSIPEDGSYTASNISPQGTTVSFSAKALKAGFYLGGTVTALTVVSGSAFVYPIDRNYAIA